MTDYYSKYLKYKKKYMALKGSGDPPKINMGALRQIYVIVKKIISRSEIHYDNFNPFSAIADINENSKEIEKLYTKSREIHQLAQYVLKLMGEHKFMIDTRGANYPLLVDRLKELVELTNSTVLEAYVYNIYRDVIVPQLNALYPKWCFSNDIFVKEKYFHEVYNQRNGYNEYYEITNFTYIGSHNFDITNATVYKYSIFKFMEHLQKYYENKDDELFWYFKCVFMSDLLLPDHVPYDISAFIKHSIEIFKKLQIKCSKFQKIIENTDISKGWDNPFVLYPYAQIKWGYLSDWLDKKIKFYEKLAKLYDNETDTVLPYSRINEVSAPNVDLDATVWRQIDSTPFVYAPSIKRFT